MGRAAPVCRWLLLFALIAAAALLFRNRGAQSLDFTFAYFSGAANSHALYDWRISPSDYQTAKSLPPGKYLGYRHRRTADVHINTYNNYGYVLVVLLARTIFWWLGEGNAVVALQIIVHAAMCVAITAILPTRVRRWSFVLLYAVNPLVLHFVTFPYYYFWAVLPCFVLAYLALGGARAVPWVLPGALLLFAGFLIRPSTLFVCLLVFALLLWQGRRLAAAAALCAFALLQYQAVGHFTTSPWHTAYIGIGAYPNPYGIDKPFDNLGFDYYRAKTGRQMSTDPINGTFQDAAERDDYSRVLRDRYMEILRQNPLLIVRNAVLNTVQSFAAGYAVDRPWAVVPGTLAGLTMIALVVFCRQWIWGLAILAYAAAFTPYFPPIPAYLFGAYLFTALAAGGIIEDLRRRWAGRSAFRS